MLRRVSRVLAVAAAVLAAGACDRRQDTQPELPSLPADTPARREFSDALRRINERIGDLAGPRPLLTLEEYFYGIEGRELALGTTSAARPPGAYFRLFHRIRSREDVRDVRVEVWQQQARDTWPAARTAWIVTSAPPEEVLGWFPKRLGPDRLLDGFAAADWEIEALDVPPRFRVVGAWWE